jgi:hypothetical protein
VRRLVLAGILAAVMAAPAAAQESPVVGAAEQIGGRTLTSWAVSWNRWVIGFPRKMLEGSGTTCLPQPAAGGPVWFLAAHGGQDAHVVSIECTVPAGSYLLLDTPEVECTDIFAAPGFPTTDRGLKRCASAYWRKLADRHPRLVLDGQALPHGPVVRPPAFRFSLPRENIFRMPRASHGRAALVARATMLRPLAPGAHTLIQGVRYRGHHNTVVVYKLTVG